MKAHREDNEKAEEPLVHRCLMFTAIYSKFMSHVSGRKWTVYTWLDTKCRFNLGLIRIHEKIDKCRQKKNASETSI